MLAAQSPITPLSDTLRAKTTGRIPLHPKNTPSSNHDFHTKPKPNPDKFLPINYANKENNPDCASPSPAPTNDTKMEMEIEIAPMDASLADELNAVRKRLERLRLDREKTERLLRERDRVFEIQLEELMQRGEFQKELEIEVDRLYRLKQLQIHCMRMSPIRSLREREMQKRTKESPSQSQNSLMEEEIVDQRVTMSASSSSESTSYM